MKLKGKKGFTLTEMIVVIAIIAILAAILIPTVTKYIKNAKYSSDESDASTMTTELTSYCSENGVAIDASKLHGTEVRTILINRGYSLKPRSKEWTFIYRDSLNKVEAIKFEDLTIEVTNNVPTSYVDPSMIASDVFLVGLGDTELEVAITALINCSSTTQYNDLGSDTSFFKASSAYRNLWAAFNPTETMYISNGSAFSDPTATSITKFVYSDTTTHVSSLSSKAKASLGAKKIPLSATIRSVESPSVSYVKQYDGVSYKTITGDDASVQKLDDQLKQNYKRATTFSPYVTYYTITPTAIPETNIDSEKEFKKFTNLIYVHDTTNKTYVVEAAYNKDNKAKYCSIVVSTPSPAITSANITTIECYEVDGVTYQFGELVEQSTSQQVSYSVVGYVGTSSSEEIGFNATNATAFTTDGAYYVIKKASDLNDASFVDTYGHPSAYHMNESYVTFSAVASGVVTASNFKNYFVPSGETYVRASGTYSSSTTYYKLTVKDQKPNTFNTTDYCLTSSTYFTKEGDVYTVASTYESTKTYYTVVRVFDLYTDNTALTKASTIGSGTYYYHSKYSYVASPTWNSSNTYYYIDENEMKSTTTSITGYDFYTPVIDSVVIGTDNFFQKVNRSLVKSSVSVTAWVYKVTISYYNASGLFARTKYEIVQELSAPEVYSPSVIDSLLGAD